MKIIYVPMWLTAALQAVGADRKAPLIDPMLLMGIVSKEDVAFYIHINSNLSKLLPSAILDTFKTPNELFNKLDASQYRPGGGGGDPDKACERQVIDLCYEYMLNGAPAPYTNPLAGITVDLLDEDTMMFHPIECDSDDIVSPSLDVKLDLYDRVIRQAYPFVSFNDLMMTPLLEDYLLTVQQLAVVVSPAEPVA